mgnify:CR=1 FL=1
MKRNLAKTLGSLFLALVLCVSTGTVAFAAESDNDVITSTQSVVTQSDRYGEYDMGEIPRKGELTLYPVLNSYVGLSRTLFFFTDNIYSDTVPSGTIRVWVYKPNNGTLLKYFTTTARADKYFSFTLPSSGTYKVVIKSSVNEKILASVGWTK